jgi:hypothetical protein
VDSLEPPNYIQNILPNNLHYIFPFAEGGEVQLYTNSFGEMCRDLKDAVLNQRAGDALPQTLFFLNDYVLRLCWENSTGKPNDLSVLYPSRYRCEFEDHMSWAAHVLPKREHWQNMSWDILISKYQQRGLTMQTDRLRAIQAPIDVWSDYIDIDAFGACGRTSCHISCDGGCSSQIRAALPSSGTDLELGKCK